MPVCGIFAFETALYFMCLCFFFDRVCSCLPVGLFFCVCFLCVLWRCLRGTSAYWGISDYGRSVPTGDQCLRGLSAYGGSLPTGDQCLRGISAYEGSVPTGGSAFGGSVPVGDQCLRGISAYGGSVPTGDQCLRGISAYRGSVPTGDVTGHRGFYLRVSSIKKMLFLWPLARG
jgi:hypothetical protein